MADDTASDEEFIIHAINFATCRCWLLLGCKGQMQTSVSVDTILDWK